tara:strand:+ start:310 stop:525 length:216 start_codon:yes stop_codon:yes gene_type:complete
LWRRIKRKTKKRKIHNGPGGFKIQKIIMEEKYFNFFMKPFIKKFKNDKNLILCSNLNCDGGINKDFRVDQN